MWARVVSSVRTCEGVDQAWYKVSLFWPLWPDPEL